MVLNGEDWKVCPHCGRSLTAKVPEARAVPTPQTKPDVKQEGTGGGVAAGIIAIIALLVGWFAFGIIFSIVAIAAGAYALKGKGGGAKALGAIGIIGGVIEFCFTLIGIYAGLL